MDKDYIKEKIKFQTELLKLFVALIIVLIAGTFSITFKQNFYNIVNTILIATGFILSSFFIFVALNTIIKINKFIKQLKS